jgi:glucan 1,3-beta-glucosidase
MQGLELTSSFFIGAQRSQNGYDNSGQFLTTPGWTTGDSVSATESVLGMIADKYAAPSYQDVVVAIELLNEPLMNELAGGEGATRSYYQNGFGTVRSVSSTSVVIHDGFQNAAHWNGFLTGPGAGGAILDHHEYQCFSNADVALSAPEHIGAVCSRAQSWGEGQDKFLIVGEWSGAMTDCAPALVRPGPVNSRPSTLLTIDRTDTASVHDMTGHTLSAMQMALTAAARMLALAPVVTPSTSGRLS